MELVDILVLGTSALVRVGSNPTEGKSFNDLPLICCCCFDKTRVFSLVQILFIFHLSSFEVKNKKDLNQKHDIKHLRCLMKNRNIHLCKASTLHILDFP